ncbi:MAG: metallopeptidase family protein [bacterium]|nr:metallopeptidase family protein [bacterium]
MTDERFEQLVSEGIEKIPARFLEKLKNVAIVVADEPSQEQLRENDILDGGTLLGLYEGVPLVERGEAYGGMVLPDKITIFKNPTLEEAAKTSAESGCSPDPQSGFRGDNEDEIRRVVKETVWHEVAHYFGYGDEEIEAREEEGTNFSK